MRPESQTECRSVTCQCLSRHENAVDKLTGLSVVKLDFHSISTSLSASKMQRLMHISHKMNEELRRFFDPLSPIQNPFRSIPNASKNIMNVVLPTSTDLLVSGEDAGLGRMVVLRSHVVQRARPFLVKANFVCPGGNGCEMALCIWWQDFTELGKRRGIEIHLGYRRRNFMAWIPNTSEYLRYTS